jgi:integrase
MKNGISKRGSTWTYTIRIPDSSTGKTKLLTKGGWASEKAAKDARDVARVEVSKGSFVKSSKITVGQYLNSWIEIHSHSIKPSTAASYRGQIARNLLPYIGNIQLSQLRPGHIQTLYVDLKSKGNKEGVPLSARSVTFAGAILSMALKHAVNVDGILASNPANKVPRPKGTPKRLEPFSVDEAKIFMEGVKEHRLFPLYRLAFYSGARLGELLALKWTDLDYRELKLVISKNRIRLVGGDIEQGSTKGGQGRRVIVIDSETVEILRSLQKSQFVERLKAGSLWNESGHIFANELGEPISNGLPSRVFQRYRIALGLREQRFHDCRHFHATQLLRSGLPLHVVAHRLGHKDAMVTATIYAHVTSDQIENASTVFAKVME